MITVVGIGWGKDEITLNGKNALKAAKYIVARTKKGLNGLKADETLDGIYESAADYDEFNSLAAARLLDLEQEYGEVIYLVTGDGFSDSTAELLSGKASVTHIAGAATIRPATTSLLQLSAYDLFLQPQLDNMPLLVTAVDSALTAGEVKLYLLKFYAFDTEVVFYGKEGAQKILLEDIDRQPFYGEACRIFVPNMTGFDKKSYTFGDLVRILQRLTEADGCPWDKEQTHKSIRSNMIEEAYEAVRAIDLDDTDNLIEELGDVMLQSVFHADMGRRGGEFELCDVLNTLCRKLYTRHTHIFGDVKADNSAEALKSWEQAKQKEKAATSADSGLGDEFKGFPALLRAQKLAKRLKKSGTKPEFAIEDDEAALGKQLFEIVWAAGEKGLDAETALNAFLNQLTR